jgi:hypothetical protein
VPRPDRTTVRSLCDRRGGGSVMSAFDSLLDALEAPDLRVRRNGGLKAEAQMPGARRPECEPERRDRRRRARPLHCHAGCAAEDIAAAVGLKMADLFETRNECSSSTWPVTTRGLLPSTSGCEKEPDVPTCARLRFGRAGPRRSSAGWSGGRPPALCLLQPGGLPGLVGAPHATTVEPRLARARDPPPLRGAQLVPSSRARPRLGDAAVR